MEAAADLEAGGGWAREWHWGLGESTRRPWFVCTLYARILLAWSERSLYVIVTTMARNHYGNKIGIIAKTERDKNENAEPL